MNTDMTINSTFKLFFAFMLCLGIAACEEEDAVQDQTFSSDELRVLKVQEGDNDIEDGEKGISAIDLAMVVTFSHTVNTDQVQSSLTVSGGASYTATFDESSSVATLSFDALDYATEYTLSLPSGEYGESGEALEEDYSLTFTTSPFITPEVTLSSEALTPEEGTTASVTATLSEATTEDVVVTLNFGGTATIDEDYSVADNTITVAVGETSASLEIALVDDEIAEGTETIEVSIAEVTNGTSEDQMVTISLVDNDVFTDLELKGIMAIRWSTEPGGNSGKAVHLRATADIADLSVYSIGVANNGGGTDSIEYTFPEMAVAAGEDILLAREDDALTTYFGDCASEIEHVIQTDAMNQNGDDAIELYSGTAVIETYGDVNVDGTGEPWEYAGSWAYKLGDNWVFGGVDCAASSTTTQDSDCTYPLCASALQLQGVMSFEADPTNSGTDTDRERAIHLRANRDIADLSIYGIGISNNGGGSDGREMDLPAISVSEGDNILFIRDDDAATLPTYLGACFDQFDVTAEDGGINFNGDDGVELYRDMEVIEVYGDVVDDGTGLYWEYRASWAYKENGDMWTYAGANCAEFAPTNAESECPYAFCN